MMPSQQSPMLAALSFYGEKPLKGPAANQQIIEFLKATSYPDPASDEIPWCSAFLVWIFKECCVDTPANAAAISWMQYSKKTDEPRIGDVVVLEWHNAKGVHRHVGLFVREVLNGIYILAGNQDGTVDIALWKKADVLSYRRYAGP